MDETDTAALLTKFEQINFDGVQEKDVVALASDLSSFFSSDSALPLLKQRENDSFLAVLRLFLRVVLSDLPGAHKPLAKHFEVVLTLLRSKCPSFKKISGWQAFEINFLACKIPKLTERVPTDDSWAEIWCFLAHVLVTDGGQTPPVNALLSVTESAFRKGKETPATMELAWTCWMSLVEAHRNLPSLIASRRVGLLLKPLKACHVNSTGRINTWIRLVDVHLDSWEENLKKCVDPFLSALYKSSKAMGPQLPDECADALSRLLSMAPVRRIYLEAMVELFKDVLNSNPSESALAKTCSAFSEAVNACEDDTVAFNNWKSLVDQCSSSSRSSQARRVLCQEISYARWFDNVKIGTDTLLELMEYPEFRDKVLLPTVKTVGKLNDIESPGAKKKKSSAFAIDWFSLCDLYISWSNQHRGKEAVDSASRLNESDHQALIALLLHPFQNCAWNPQISNKWQMVCQVCHKWHLLESMVENIFETAVNSTFEIQRAIDVLNYACQLDSSLCSKSSALFEKITSKIDTVELKSLNDLLYVSENASTITELQPALIAVLKGVNDTSNRFDDSLRIRIKVAKLLRKIEPLNSLVDVEQTNNKPQRSPFRTQSNFQHRLSKAEEKKKFKMSLGSSRMFSPDANKLEADPRESHLSPSHDKPENSPINSGSSPISHSPELIDEAPKCKNQEAEEVKDVMVAEKENLNIPAIIEPIFPSSPSVLSPGNKMKITNARELKAADGHSPTVKVKPVAGQKSPGLLKAAPPKVSYFDDDASDCVMVPPKPKTTPLTEHQKEILSKRRTDIPALYQDLSQDTQISVDEPPSSMIIADIPETVPETQSQNVSSTLDASTPECHEKNKRSCHSAKRLDFNSPLIETEKSSNNLEDEPVTNFFAGDSSDKTEVQSSEATSPDNVVPVSGIHAVDVDTPLNGEQREEDIVSSSILESTISETKNDNIQVDNDTSSKKRKRKSEPNKFSPKLTRSRKQKNQNSTNNVPLDAKEEEVESKKARLAVTAADGEVSPSLENSSAQPDDEKKSLQDQEFASKMEIPCVSSTNLVETSPNPSQEEVSTPKNQKKSKTSNEVVTDDSKKLTSSKKKKKLFRLTPTSNKLENWLIRPDRVPEKDTLPVSTVAESEPLDAGKEPNSDLAEPLADSAELSSQDIVPGTQDLTASINPLNVQLIAKIDPETAAEENQPWKDKVEESPNPELTTTITTIVESHETLEVKNEDSTAQKSSSKTDESTPDRISAISEFPSSDDIELIIASPKGKRASSVVRDTDKETLATENICDDWSPKRMRRSKTGSSPRKNTRLALHPAAGRSAKMLRLLDAPNHEEDRGEQTVTPVRRRESIVPQTFGENWPKGPTQDWVARLPSSPYMSPLRSTLKKTPGKDEDTNCTPQRRNQDSFGSPLLSSIKKKRVTFIDPVVTSGLLTYEDGSGALHLADVPIPSLMSDYKQAKAPDPDGSPARPNDTVCPAREKEVREKMPTTDVSDPVLKNFQRRFNLDDTFVDEISKTPYRIQGLIFDCFNSKKMQDAIDDFRVAEYMQLRKLPYPLLRRVENYSKENLAEVLGLKPEQPAVWVQTDPPPAVEDKQTHTSVPVSPAFCQTDGPDTVSVGVSASPATSSASTNAVPETASVGSSARPSTADVSTQADVSLPSDDDLLLIVEREGFPRTLRSLSRCLNVISRLAPE